MVADPEHHFESFKAAGADSVTFHAEVSANPAGTIAKARALGLGVGVAFNPETSVEDGAAAAEGADLALCMSIHPGYSGQSFMGEAFERIAELRRRLPESVHVQVDGGVNAGNIVQVRGAGADLVIAGAAVFWQDDPAAAYRAIAAAFSSPARSG
jgi:ribulose-phosphate 3-epimerase